MIRFLEVAKQELDEAVAFHEAQAQGLGQSFLAEALAALDLVRRYPEAWHPISANARRCRLRRFPYGIIYLASDEGIIVIAVAHMHRRPGYWRERACKT